MLPDSHDLNFSNRPVRTRMPGGVGGARSGILTAPIPICGLNDVLAEKGLRDEVTLPQPT